RGAPTLSAAGASGAVTTIGAWSSIVRVTVLSIIGWGKVTLKRSGEPCVMAPSAGLVTMPEAADGCGCIPAWPEWGSCAKAAPAVRASAVEKAKVRIIVSYPSVLEPGLEADHETHVLGVLAAGLGVIGRVAQRAAPLDAGIGREFLADFIAQAQPRRDRGQARAQPQFRDVARRHVQFERRLQDPLLGDALVIFGFEAGGQVAVGRQEGGGAHLEPVGGHALDADGQVGRVVAVGTDVLAQACLQIPEGGDGTAVEGLELGLVQFAAELAFALGLPPEAVDVAAGPALGLPTVAVGAVAEVGFEGVDEYGGRADVAVLGQQLLARRSHDDR